MLVIFPLIFGVMACGMVVLTTVLGRMGSTRFGGLVGILAALVPAATLLAAALVAIATAPHLDDSDNYGRMAAWAVMIASSATAITSLVGIVVLVLGAIKATRADGALLKDGAGLGSSIGRAVMIIVWTIVAVFVASLAIVLPTELLFGGAPPEWVQQMGGLGLIAATISTIVLGVRGVLPGTKRAQHPAETRP